MSILQNRRPHIDDACPWFSTPNPGLAPWRSSARMSSLGQQPVPNTNLSNAMKYRAGNFNRLLTDHALHTNGLFFSQDFVVFHRRHIIAASFRCRDDGMESSWFDLMASVHGSQHFASSKHHILSGLNYGAWASRALASCQEWAEALSYTFRVTTYRSTLFKHENLTLTHSKK